MFRTVYAGGLLLAALGCEPYRAPPPDAPIAACCGGFGACLPVPFVAPEDRASLAAESCGTDRLCVPDQLRSGAAPPSCRTDSGSEGRCLPSCLPSVSAQLDRLQQAGCQEHQRCVPCYDPITGDYTSACSLGDDPGPELPPRVFGQCCENLGRCVPSQLVAADQRSSLGRDLCSAADELCVPAPLLGGAPYVPAHCTSQLFGSEGRCLPACLPQLAAQLDALDRETCAQGELCAPCFDPRSGEATGSCKIGADPGPQQPAVVLGQCCAGLGRCLPDAALSSQQRDQLGRDECMGASERCVPQAFVADPQHIPARCEVSALGAEGRCLPECMPAVQARGELLARDECQEHERCVPCHDPIDGKPSGACELGGDPGPSEAVVVLGTCCGGLGRCAPKLYVPQSAAALLEQGECRGDQLCVAPRALLESGAGPTPCHDPGTRAEGRCLPSCLSAVAAGGAALAQAECPEAFRCVPCFDPRTGESTEACSLGDDPGPSEPPVRFSGCCAAGGGGDLGLCVPRAILPATTPELPVDRCTASDQVCAPAKLVADPNATFATCSTVLSGVGVCIPSCFLQSLPAATLLSQVSCASGELCAPCSSLEAGSLGC